MIRTDLRLPHPYTPADLRDALTAHIPVTPEEAKDYRLIRDTLEVGENGIYHRLAVGLSLGAEREAGLAKMRKKVSLLREETLSVPRVAFSRRPVVAGFGPAGIFAALILAEAGARPIVFERGLPVDRRVASVNAFHRDRTLDPESNIQFGEGGAGTFSDGKLKVGAPDAVKNKVLTSLVSAGAPEEILWSGAPHVGTDLLSGIVKKLREEIVSLGGEVRFSSRLTDIDIADGKVTSVEVETPYGREKFDTGTVFLATGHSARDTFRLLSDLGLPMQARPFGIGMRLEHPRAYIDGLIYGKGHPSDLPPASYRFVTHLPDGRSVYSFCMCPGGTVVAATSSENAVVTNGMSVFKRDGGNSNAAYLVSVTPADFGSDDPLAGIALQEKIERAAFLAGGSDYSAPALRLCDFLSGATSGGFGDVRPTYPLGVRFARPESYFPAFIPDALRAGFADFEAYRPGFLLPDAVLTGAETRSTSPVRVLRDDATYASPVARGLYPIGEGAGYAGGIVSSAADGIRAALASLHSADAIPETALFRPLSPSS